LVSETNYPINLGGCMEKERGVFLMLKLASSAKTENKEGGGGARGMVRKNQS